MGTVTAEASFKPWNREAEKRTFLFIVVEEKDLY
jgi:hypothetical protein